MAHIDCSIYFFVDSDGQIQINHLYNDADEIRNFLGYRHDYPILLFSYNYKSGVLTVLNVDEDSLKEMLSLLKKYRQNKSLSTDEKLLVGQLKTASTFLKNNFNWGGEIQCSKNLENKLIESKVSDFNLAWSYLKSILKEFGIDPIDVSVYIVPILKEHSLFVNKGKTVELWAQTIEGPAILIKKCNSVLFINEGIIYQYILNFHHILDFDPCLHHVYLTDAKEYIDSTFANFLKHSSIANHTYWYLTKENGHIYLHKNDHLNNKFQLMEDNFSVVLTFEYIVVEDSRYIVFNDLTAKGVSISDLYKKMIEFLMEHLESIGHVDENGKVLEEKPILLFSGFQPHVEDIMLSNLPIWVLIYNILTILWDIPLIDIRIIKGNFHKPFTFKYIGNNSDKSWLKEYLSPEDLDEPVILWNRISYDPIIAQLMELIDEYKKFISEKMGREKEPGLSDLEIRLNKFLSSMKNPEFILFLENLIMIAVDEFPSSHEYNLFRLLLSVVGINGIVSENMLQSHYNSKSTNRINELVRICQQKLYFLTLKSMATLFELKYGINCTREEKIIKGDIVITKNREHLASVEMVKLEPSNSEKTSQERIVYVCKDLITSETLELEPDDINLFTIDFEEAEAYNKHASKVSNDKDLSFGSEYYIKILEQFLRKQYRKKPLDATDENKEKPNFNAFLERQRKSFNREEGDRILENMLNNCRKVKTYAN